MTSEQRGPTFGKPRRAVVSYEQAHLRLKVWRGRPDTMQCVACGETAALELPPVPNPAIVTVGGGS